MAKKGDLIPRHPSRGLSPEQKFLNDDESMDFILNILAEESPRVFDKTMLQLKEKFYAFRTRLGDPQQQIRFSDLLTLSYIFLRYPYLIDFFIGSINELLPPMARNQELERMYKGLDDKKNKKDTDITNWITEVTGHVFSSDAEKIRATKLTGAVAHLYFARLKGSYDDKDKIRYEGSSSYPENLNDYLNVIPGYTVNVFTQSHQILKQHQKNKILSDDITVKDLYEYSRFLRHFAKGDVSAKFNLDTAKMILHHISTGAVKPTLIAPRDTDLQSIIYEFCFQLLEAIENEDKGKVKTVDVIEVFKESLSTDYLAIGGKYQILNVFANNKRDPGADIHRRMDRAFEEMTLEDKQIEDTIRSVFKKADDLYFRENQVIYNKEENFFYVLYQGWSGNPSAQDEIERIQNVAMRGLVEFPDAIRIYWDQFPYNKGDKSVDDSLRLDFGENRTDLYMPLENLIEVTKKVKLKFKDDSYLLRKIEHWTKIAGNSSERAKYKEKRKIKPDQTTLKASLLARKILR